MCLVRIVMAVSDGCCELDPYDVPCSKEHTTL